jgi:hypothetical protein
MESRYVSYYTLHTRGDQSLIYIHKAQQSLTIRGLRSKWTEIDRQAHHDLALNYITIPKANQVGVNKAFMQIFR